MPTDALLRPIEPPSGGLQRLQRRLAAISDTPTGRATQPWLVRARQPMVWQFGGLLLLSGCLLLLRPSAPPHSLPHPSNHAADALHRTVTGFDAIADCTIHAQARTLPAKTQASGNDSGNDSGNNLAEHQRRPLGCQPRDTLVAQQSSDPDVKLYWQLPAHSG